MPPEHRGTTSHEAFGWRRASSSRPGLESKSHNQCDYKEHRDAECHDCPVWQLSHSHPCKAHQQAHCKRTPDHVKAYAEQARPYSVLDSYGLSAKAVFVFLQERRAGAAVLLLLFAALCWLAGITSGMQSVSAPGGYNFGGG